MIMFCEAKEKQIELKDTQHQYVNEEMRQGG